MRLLHAGVDTTSVIALWLGHEKTNTVQIYLHAELSMKNAPSPSPPPPWLRPVPGSDTPNASVILTSDGAVSLNAASAGSNSRKRRTSTRAVT